MEKQHEIQEERRLKCKDEGAKEINYFIYVW
jgi:hypothetical protein